MSGSAFDNLCMFRKLCGNDCLDSVVLVTTFWDTVAPEEGRKRSQQLEEDDSLWGRMKKSGSRIMTLQNDRDDALRVLVEASRNTKTVLQAQREMVDEGKASHQTVAAQFSATCGERFASTEQQRIRLEALRDVARRRSADVKKMKARLESTDEQLAAVKEELMAETKCENVDWPSQKPRKDHKRRCRLLGKARCARCGTSIKKMYFRKSIPSPIGPEDL
jgi:hypothetical protein